MEWSLDTVVDFLKPLLDAYNFDAMDVMEVTFRPGGAEIITYVRNSEGDVVLHGDSIAYTTTFVRYHV